MELLNSAGDLQVASHWRIEQKLTIPVLFSLLYYLLLAYYLLGSLTVLAAIPGPQLPFLFNSHVSADWKDNENSLNLESIDF